MDQLFLVEMFKPISIGLIVAGFVAFISIMFPYYIGGSRTLSEIDEVRQM